MSTKKLFAVYFDNGEEILDIGFFHTRKEAVDCIKQVQDDYQQECELYGKDYWNQDMSTKKFSIVEELLTA